MNYNLENIDQVLLSDEIVIEHKLDRVHCMDKPHFHDGFEIHYTLTNGTNYQIDERKFNADAGSIALFNPHELHRVSINHNKLYERYYILFKPTFIQEITSDFPFLFDIYTQGLKKDCIELTQSNQQVITKIFDDLVYLNNTKEKKYHSLKLKLKLTELLVTLNELVMDDRKIHQPIDYENQQLIADIVSYIKKNYREDITLDDLSNYFFISKSTILRLFKKAMGMTPNQFLISTRIITSRDLLKKGYTVRQTAQRIGYKDESSFIKKFKELQGDSPKQYAMKLIANS